MATSTQAIRRLTIEGRTTGMGEVVTSLDAVARAQTKVTQTSDGMAKSTDASAKRQLSAAGAYDRLLKSVDDTYRVQSKFGDGQRRIEAAFKQGVIDAAEYSRTMQLLADKFGVVSLAATRQAAELERAASVQARINALSGVTRGSDGAARANDVEAYGQAMDRLQAKYDPLFAASDRYKKALADIDNAYRVGAISAEVATQNRLKEVNSYNAEVTALERVSAARKSAAQATVNQQTIVPDRGADIAAYGKQLDDLRAKYNPLYAAGRQYKEVLAEINMAARVGAITEAERAAAVMNTKVAFVQQTNTLRGVHDAQSVASGSATKLGAAVGLNANEWKNLGFQVNDAVTMLASGSSAFQVVATQGGQVYQVLTGANGGISGALKSVTGYLGSVVTVGRVAFGGLAVAIGSAAMALSSYLDSQQKVQMSLLGSGRASGQSVSSINAVAQTGSSLTGFSTSEARAFAAELASTGKIGRDNLEPLVKIGHDIATVYGVDASEAAKLLGKAFSDPVSGAEQLNARLGFLDAAMQRNIQNLVAQNRTQEAQRVLQAGVKSGLEGVSDAVATSTKFWTALGNVASNVWDKIGEAASRATGIGLKTSLDDQLKTAQARLKELEAIASTRSSAVNSGLGTTSQIDQQRAKVDELTAAMQRYSQSSIDAQQRQQSFAQAGAVRNQLPEIDQLQKLRNEQELLVKTMIDVQVSGGPASDILKRMGMSYEELAKAVSIANGSLSTFKNEFQSQSSSLKIANDSITAFSPGAKGEIARRQSLESTVGSKMDPGERAALGQQAYDNAVKSVTVSLSEQARSRLLYANQTVQSAQLDIELVGKSIGQQAELRANLQARQALEQQASQNRTTLDEAEYARLQKINAEYAKRVQQAAMAAANSNVKFDIDTAFLTDAEKQIASLNRQLHGEDWKNYSDDALSNQMRLANGVKEFASLFQDVNRSIFTDFSQQIRAGASAFDALKTAGANALGKIADKLASMAADNLWASAFGGGSGGGLLSLLGLGGGSGAAAQAQSASTLANGTGGAFYGPGFATGGYTGAGTKYQPAGVVHAGEYVFSQASVGRIGLGNLDRLHRGYADGGPVMPFIPAPANGNSSGGVVMQDNRTIHIGEGASQETVAQLRAELAKDRAMRKAETIAIMTQARSERKF